MSGFRLERLSPRGSLGRTNLSILSFSILNRLALTQIETMHSGRPVLSTPGDKATLDHECAAPILMSEPTLLPPTSTEQRDVHISISPTATDASAVATDELRVESWANAGPARWFSSEVSSKSPAVGHGSSWVQVFMPPRRCTVVPSFSPGNLVRTRWFGRVLRHGDKAAGRTFSSRSSGTAGSFAGRKCTVPEDKL